MATLEEWQEDLANKDTLFLQKINHAIAALLLWPMFAQEFDSIHQIQAAVNEELIGHF